LSHSAFARCQIDESSWTINTSSIHYGKVVASMAREGLWLITLGVCLVSCTRSPTPASHPPNSLQLSTRADIHGTQPATQDESNVVADSAATSHSLQLPQKVEKLLEPKNQPAWAESDRAQVIRAQLLERDAGINRYLQRLMSDPGLAKPADVTKIIEDLVSLSLANVRLPPAQHIVSWETAARLLQPPTAPETSIVVAQAFRAAARSIAGLTAECKMLDPAVIRFLAQGGAPPAATLQLRYEFSVARFESGRSSCRVFPEQELDRLDEEQRARLSSLIGDESRSHATSEMALAYRGSCRSKKPAPAVVASGICPWATGDIGGMGISEDGEPALKPSIAGVFVHHMAGARSDAADKVAPLEVLLTKVAIDAQRNLVDRVQRAIADQKREYWLNAGKTILVLAEAGPPDPDYTRIRIAIVTNAGFKIAPVPITFGQYDDDSIAEIADADADDTVGAAQHVKRRGHASEQQAAAPPAEPRRGAILQPECDE